MKNKLLIIQMILIVGLGLSYVESDAQCNSTSNIDKCIPNLPDGFTFLKGYEISGEKVSTGNKIEYSYPFAKDTQYVVNICTEGGNPSEVIITIFDYQRNELASSKIDGQYVSAVVFNCKATGIYYMTYTLENGTNYCGGSVLGFKR